MSYSTTSGFGVGPLNSHKIINYLIIATAGMTIGSALFDQLFTRVIGTVGPQELFSLSPYGLYKGYIWQPFTYFFIQQSAHGISFWFLIHLLFNMYHTE